MLFETRPCVQPLKAITLENGNTLEYVTNVKLLGFQVDENLNWKQHIDMTCKNISKGIYALKQLRPYVSEENVKQSYYAYVHSVMSYGIILWGSSTDSERILKMQKRAIRVLVKAGYRDSCREYFKKLQILTSVSVYILEMIMYVRKNITEFRYNNCARYNNNRIQIAQHRLNITKQLPRIMGAKLFNKLPKCIINLESDNAFRHNVQKLLLDKTLYSIREYLDNDYKYYIL